MTICSKCNAPVEDGAIFCAACGNKVQPDAAPVYAAPVPMYDPYDHTAEFDAKDISENKVVSMLVYLMGAIGIIIALLAANQSKYAAFHVRQALKFTVIEILTGIVAAFTFFTVIVPVAAVIFLAVLWVVKIICFFQICSGKAKEPAIIRSFTFLR